MVIVGWNGSGSLGAIFDKDVFKKVLTIFITSAYLTLLQGCDFLCIFLFTSEEFFLYNGLMALCPSSKFFRQLHWISSLISMPGRTSNFPRYCGTF